MAIVLNQNAFADLLEDMGITLFTEVSISGFMPAEISEDLPPQTLKLLRDYPEAVGGLYSPMCVKRDGVWHLMKHNIWVRDPNQWTRRAEAISTMALIHEVVHCSQAESRGAEGFRDYNDQCERRFGYKDNPLEVEAYKLSEWLWKTVWRDNPVRLLEEVF